MADGIDARVVLGLAGKMSQVFVENGTYLGFPMAAMGMKRADFTAVCADPLGAGARAAAEFSLLVNELPAGPIWQPDGGRLWDVYGDVLRGAELAKSTLTAAQQADYGRAYATLYEANPDGSVTDSPAAIAYEHCRDAYLAAAQEYNNRKGQAELSTDPAIKRQWAKDEPTLGAQVEDAEKEWSSAGHRVDIEGARKQLCDLGSAAPEMVWAGYLKLFDPGLPEIYFRTSAEGSMYLPTSYLPSNVADISWPQITMNREELAAMAGKAPDGLRQRLGTNTDTGITQVSFEYSSVSVNRPWYAEDVFASRAWRFYQPQRVLSDGDTPPKGECTSYVSGLVLARHITVTRQPDAPSGPTELGFLPPIKKFAEVPELRFRPYPPSELRARIVTRVNVRTDISRIEAPVLRPVVQPPVRAVAVPARGRLRTSPGDVLTPWPQPPAGDAQTSTGPDDLYILAFICRLMPKCPDPDPSYSW